MSHLTYLHDKEAVSKLKDLATTISTCLFCSGPGGDGDCRPMTASGVDDEGSLWFLSDRNSLKNREIASEPRVRLFYSHPGKNSFLVVSGEAEIVYDRDMIRRLWNTLDKTWFKEGEDDPSISLIRVRPEHARYWDAKGNAMVNFIKMVASVASGKTL